MDYIFQFGRNLLKINLINNKDNDIICYKIRIETLIWYINYVEWFLIKNNENQIWMKINYNKNNYLKLKLINIFEKYAWN